MLAEDTLTFWKGIADVGLLGEVVTNISSELLEMLNGVQQRQETAALQDTGMQRRRRSTSCFLVCPRLLPGAETVTSP